MLPRAVCEVDLDAVAANVEVLRGRAPGAALLAVVKADAYGHGLVPAARAALEPVYRQYAGMFIVVAGLRLVVGEFPVRRILHRLELRPAQTVALGFALTILAGTVLLSLPPAVNHLESVSILNALFMATSAVTVTVFPAMAAVRYTGPFSGA